MADSGPHVVLHLGLTCRDASGNGLRAFLREARPFYESLSDVKLRLLRSLDRPGRFIEVIEYGTEAAFQSDRARLARDERMRELLGEWRGLLMEPPSVEHYADLTSEIEGGAHG